MQSSTFLSAAGMAILPFLLTLIQSATTTGTMTVLSHCPYPVWVQFVPQSGGNPQWKIVPSAGVSLAPVIPNYSPPSPNTKISLTRTHPQYTFPWSKYPPVSATDCDGVSIKLGLKDFTGQTAEPITQAEVAWNSTYGSVIYDISDLNAYGPSPFYKQGYVMWANKAATARFPLCQTIHCGAWENPCTDVYWYGMYLLRSS